MVPNVLKEILTQEGIGQVQPAKRIDMSRGYINKICSKKTTPAASGNWPPCKKNSRLQGAGSRPIRHLWRIGKMKSARPGKNLKICAAASNSSMAESPSNPMIYSAAKTS